MNARKGIKTTLKGITFASLIAGLGAGTLGCQSTNGSCGKGSCGKGSCGDKHDEAKSSCGNGSCGEKQDKAK